MADTPSSNEPTFFEKITSGFGDTTDNFFDAALDKLAGRQPETESVGGQLFAAAAANTRQRRGEVSKRAANSFRKTRFGQDFINETKKQELIAFISNPVTIIGLLLVTVIVIGFARR